MDYKKWREEVEYIMKTGTLEQVELCENWLMGIGLQKVDNLKVSSYLLDLALQNIKGEIEYSELERRLTEYYGRKEHEQ